MLDMTRCFYFSMLCYDDVCITITNSSKNSLCLVEEQKSIFSSIKHLKYAIRYRLASYISVHLPYRRRRYTYRMSNHFLDMDPSTCVYWFVHICVDYMMLFSFVFGTQSYPLIQLLNIDLEMWIIFEWDFTDETQIPVNISHTKTLYPCIPYRHFISIGQRRRDTQQRPLYKYYLYINLYLWTWNTETHSNIRIIKYLW